MNKETKKRALLIMDMVDVYIYGEKPLIPIENRGRLIVNVKKAIELAHKNSIPVVYVNSAFRETDPIYKNYINYRDQAMKGSRHSETIIELTPTSNDYIVYKRGYDGFWKSGLERLLRKLKMQELYLVGCQTDCCVRETAVTAAHLGYDVYVIEDCCDTSRELGQVSAIRFMRTCTKAILNVNNIVW